jgi:anti-sigma factor RsiW
MTCDRQLLVQAHFDGELDAAASVEIESHLATCAECREWLGTLQNVRAGIRASVTPRAAPAHLRRAIASALDEADKPAVTGWRIRLPQVASARRPLLIGAFSSLTGAAVAAALMIAFLLPNPSAQMLDEVTTAHVRSLMADHLIDVASSDQHTVKPWFDGRVDVAPPVADFGGEGFELVGGRAEYIAGKRIPALVYRKGRHIINLMIWPAEGPQTDGLRDHNGFHILTWHSGDLVFCAVSDVMPDQLRLLAKLVQDEAARTRTE